MGTVLETRSKNLYQKYSELQVVTRSAGKEGSELSEASIQIAKVLISDDGLEAHLVFNGGMDTALPSKEEIALLLGESGIVFGIREAAMESLVHGNSRAERILIAEGIKPVPGKDGWVDYRFKQPNLSEAEKEAKKVDYHSLGWIHNVLKSEMVAELHPAEPGFPGTTVTGKAVQPKPAKAPAVLLGKHVALDPNDQNFVVAIENGNSTVDLDGTLHVETTITIHGNVDYATGDIDFVGSVIITGDVKTDFSVKARESIEIMGNVEDARIEAGGDVVIKNGFMGTGKGVLVAGGKATIHHVLNQTVTSGSEISITQEAICGKLTAVDKIVAPTATFIGCVLGAGREIVVCNLGNGEERQSWARVGRRAMLLERVNQVDKEMAAVQKQVIDAKDTIYKIVRIQLDKGTLSPEQQQLHSKLRSLQPDLQRKAEQLQKDKQGLTRELEKDSMARIVVRDTLFPNVSLELNGLRKVNHNALKEVVLVECGGKIEERPLE